MTYTNNKTVIPILFRHIEQFLIDCYNSQQKSDAMNQIIINKLFHNRLITISNIENVSKQEIDIYIAKFFTLTLQYVKPINFIKHFIDIKRNICPLYLKIPCHHKKKL